MLTVDHDDRYAMLPSPSQTKKEASDEDSKRSMVSCSKCALLKDGSMGEDERKPQDVELICHSFQEEECDSWRRKRRRRRGGRGGLKGEGLFLWMLFIIISLLLPTVKAMCPNSCRYVKKHTRPRSSLL